MAAAAEWMSLPAVAKTTVESGIARSSANTVDTTGHEENESHIQLWHPPQTHFDGGSTYDATNTGTPPAAQLRVAAGKLVGRGTDPGEGTRYYRSDFDGAVATTSARSSPVSSRTRQLTAADFDASDRRSKRFVPSPPSAAAAAGEEGAAVYSEHGAAGWVDYNSGRLLAPDGGDRPLAGRREESGGGGGAAGAVGRGAVGDHIPGATPVQPMGLHAVAFLIDT